MIDVQNQREQKERSEELTSFWAKERHLFLSSKKQKVIWEIYIFSLDAAAAAKRVLFPAHFLFPFPFQSH